MLQLTTTKESWYCIKHFTHLAVRHWRMYKLKMCLGARSEGMMMKFGIDSFSVNTEMMHDESMKLFQKVFPYLYVLLLLYLEIPSSSSST